MWRDLPAPKCGSLTVQWPLLGLDISRESQLVNDWVTPVKRCLENGSFVTYICLEDQMNLENIEQCDGRTVNPTACLANDEQLNWKATVFVYKMDLTKLGRNSELKDGDGCLTRLQ